jgi:hypothetical protein
MRGYSKTWNMFFYVRRPLLSPVLEYGLEVAMLWGYSKAKPVAFYSFQGG